MTSLILLAAGRVVSNSWINVIQKQLVNQKLHPLLVVAVNFILLALFLIPVSLFVSFSDLPPRFWITVSLAALLDTPGNIFLVKSVGEIDLSIFGPLNAYKPILAMILGIFFLGEIPTWIGLLGVVVVFAGSLLLSPGGIPMGFRALAALTREKGIRYRFLSLLMIAAAAIFLKAAIEQADPVVTLIIWVYMSTPIAYLSFRSFSARSGRDALAALRSYPGKLLVLAVLFLGMQGCTLLLFYLMDVAYALSIFQLSAVISVLFGYSIFKESHILQRTAGAVVMCAGAAIIFLAG